MTTMPASWMLHHCWSSLRMIKVFQTSFVFDVSTAHYEIRTWFFKCIGFQSLPTQIKSVANREDFWNTCLLVYELHSSFRANDCSLILGNEYPGIQFQAKTYLLSPLLMLRDGITVQTLKKTDEIGITRIVSTGPVNLFTGKAIHLHNVLTGFQKSNFFGQGVDLDIICIELLQWIYGFTH